MNLSLHKGIIFFLLFIGSITTYGQSPFEPSAIQTIPFGSYIVDMGVTPQTIGNGLKPYGMVYDLVRFYQTPVTWSVNQNKVKDGVDFTYNGQDFKGGTFIIEVQNRTAAVDAVISSWELQGVIGITTTSDINVPVYKELAYFPNWTLDAGSGSKVIPYLENAGIPADAYNFKLPFDLDCCDDIFILPHSDPTWEDHGNLYNWNASFANGGCNGWVWSACHGVSVLEQVVNPSDPTQKLNFLMEDPGAVDFGDHGKGTPPYTYENPGDIFMQFMGTFDGATENGSEQIYMPQTDWRPSTQISVYDPDMPDIPGLTPGPAAKLAYGFAYGDNTRGMVMYEGGHSHNNGTEQELVAAQRAFLNFCFLAPANSNPQVSANVPIGIPSGEFLDLLATATSEVPSGFTFSWTSTCDTGYFDNPFVANPTYFAPTVEEPLLCAITVVAKDDCGRETLFTQDVLVLPGPLPPIAENDSGTTPPYLPITLDAFANDLDLNMDPLTITAYIGPLVIPGEGTFTDNGDGTVTFTPETSFTGVSQIDYIVCDTTSLCDTATLVVTVAYPDTDGDGIADDVDQDDDNDGIPDTAYYSGTDPSADDDMDGFPNYVDPDFTGFVDANSDGVNDNFDTDGDGIADHLDIDSDNDGIPDAIEANGGTAPTGYDVMTGTISGAVDANGIPVAASGGITPEDFDGDGLLDLQDLDSDNDGIADLVEAGGTDADGDGIPDGYTDANGDGMDDATLDTPLPIPSTDSDGLADYLDIDADNDGIVDNIEAQSTPGYIAPSGTDTDGDGIDDAYDTDNGGTPIALNDLDGDLTPDYLDGDSDDDGVADTTEGNDANMDGVADVDCSAMLDTDMDGLYDCYDTSAVSFNPLGSNAPIQNTDGTLDNDWRDIDDDDDGVLTSLDPSYLINPCGPREGLLLVNNHIYADSIIQTELEGNTNVSNAQPSLGAPDQGVTGKKVKNTSDILELRMTDTIPSGSTVVIFGVDQSVDIRVSPDRVTWTTLATDLFLGANSLADSDTLTTSVDFLYIEFKKGSSGNAAKIDAVEGIFISELCLMVPVANNDTVSTYENIAVEIDVQANDNEAFGNPITTSILSDPLNGSVVLNNDSTVTYTPNTNYFGIDSFEYIICNPANKCDTAIVVITVDSIPCSDGKEPIIFPLVKHAYADSTVTCVRDNSASGDCDAKMLGAPDGAATGDFKRVNDIAVMRMEEKVPSGSSVEVHIKTFDNDANLLVRVSLNNIAYTTIATITNADLISGVYTFNAPVTFNYIELDHLGADGKKIQFDAIDATILYDSISCFNPIPIAENDDTTTTVNTAITIDVLVNDSDPLADSLVTDTVLISPLNGSAVINPDGTITYTPDTGFTGTDSFQYVVCDTVVPPACDTATVMITIPNDAPVAVNDFDTTEMNTPVSIDVTDNDTDPENGTITPTNIITQPVNGGIAAPNASGEITYTPAPNFIGVDSFTYEVCDDGTPQMCDSATVVVVIEPLVNDPPLAVNDTTETELHEPVVIAVLDNDMDPESNPITIDSIFSPSNGTVSVDGSGNVTYTPDALFTGVDQFDYIVCDDQIPSLCDTATVIVMVTPPVNDPPTATDDNFNAYDGTTSTFDVTPNDIDYDGNIDSTTADTVTGPSHGTLVVNGDGTFDYTPTPGYTGADQYTYMICDDGTPLPPQCDTATVNITVNAVNQPPTALDDHDTTQVNQQLPVFVDANDSDPEGGLVSTSVMIIDTPVNGTASVSPNGMIIYVPDSGYIGNDSLTYQICDNGGLCDTATLYVHIPNESPIAIFDQESTTQNTAVDINLTINDVDPDFGNLAINAANTDGTSINGGTITVLNDSTVTYDPLNGFSGLDTFNYEVCDDQTPQKCTTTYVVIDVQTNEPPVAFMDMDSAIAGLPESIDVLSNDYDLTGELDPATVTILIGSEPANGTAIPQPDGTIIYTSNNGYSGVDSFEYVVCDVGMPVLCDTTSVFVLVIPDFNALVAASDDSSSSLYNLPINISVLSNDTAFNTVMDSSGISVLAGSGPSNGIAIPNPDGTITYQPDNNFFGLDSFQYVVCDTSMPPVCDTAFVYIEIFVDSAAIFCFLVGDGTNELFSIDRFTGDATLIGSLGVSSVEGIGFSQSADTLYGADAGTFGIIDMMSGAFTAIGSFGSGSGSIGFKSFSDVDGLTYDAFDDIMYGSVRTNGNDLIIQINTQTGAHIPDAFNGDDYAVVSGTGILGDIDDIAIDPGTGKMYAISNTSGSGDVLVEIDKETGNATVIGSVGVDDMEGFGFANDGALYGTTGGGGSSPNRFWSININTGAASVIAVLPGSSSDYEACDCMVVPFEIPVVAVDDADTTSQGIPQTIDVLSNDFGPLFASTLDTTGVLQPANGNISLDSTGTITYAPDMMYLGFDSFEYIICDSAAFQCDTAMVVIQVFGPEICDNNIDDNGNGLIDCDDNFCEPGDPGAIFWSGAPVCVSATGEAYTISAVPEATSYNWTVPSGATITSGQGSNFVLVNWGSAGGSVCVEALIGSCVGPQSCITVVIEDVLPKPGLINFK